MARNDPVELALAAVERIMDTRDEQRLIDEVKEAFAPFGFEGFAIARVPDELASANIEVHLPSWPADWIARYLRSGYCGIDPIVRHARCTTEPFLWSEAVWDPDGEPRARRMMEDARTFGLCNGLAVPILAARGNLEVVSLSGTADTLSPEDRRAIRLIAIYAHHRACEIAKRGSATRPAARTRTLQ